VGGFAFLMAFNLLLPGLMPAGVRLKPRYEEETFVQVYFEVVGM